MKSLAFRTSPALLVGALLLACAACDWDWQQPTMRYQGRIKPYEETEFFDNGSSAQPSVPDTVPHTVQAGWASPVDSVEIRTGKTGKPGATKLVAKIPIPVTRQLIERGRQRFNIYCIACHGLTGHGDGIVTQRGFPNPPSYHQDRLRKIEDGHFFDVITNGFGRMFRYGDRIPTYDRWAIVAYIRALQASEEVKASSLSPEERAKIVEPNNEATPLTIDRKVEGVPGGAEGPVKERR
jgi:mono/diheme cytochrome c family protein